MLPKPKDKGEKIFLTNVLQTDVEQHCGQLCENETPQLITKISIY